MFRQYSNCGFRIRGDGKRLQETGGIDGVHRGTYFTAGGSNDSKTELLGYTIFAPPPQPSTLSHSERSIAADGPAAQH